MLMRLPDLRALTAFTAAALRWMAAVWLILAVAAIFLMTLGTDEAWVLNGLRSALEPRVENLTTELIVTNGGPFALMNLLAETLAGSTVWLARCLSLAWLLCAFAVVVREARRIVPQRVSALPVLAPIFAFPGIAEIGTAALGTSAGLFFMVAALALWSRTGTALKWRVVGTGVLYGLAAASRFDLVLLGPAILLASSVRSLPGRRIQLRLDFAALAAVVIGVALFMANQWLMSLPANAVVAANVAGSTGISGVRLDYPKLLNAWATASTIAPLAFLVALAASAFWSEPEATEKPAQAGPHFESLLAVAGLTLFAGWLFRAPIPHLRYLLPALFCVAVLGGIGLLRIASAAAAGGRLRQQFICGLVALACVAGGVSTTVRSLVMADSDYASWEWTHEIPFDYFRRFEAKGEQARIAAYLQREVPADARIYSFVPYALRYLTHRPIVAIDTGFDPADRVVRRNRFVVLTPAVGTYLTMSAEVQDWLLKNSVLQKEIGRYSVYRLRDGDDAALNHVKVLRTNYEGHPASKPWFGRHWASESR